MSSAHNTSKPPLPPWRNPRWPQPPTAPCSPSILDRPAPPPCHPLPDPHTRQQPSSTPFDLGIPVPVGGAARPVLGRHPLAVDTPKPAKKYAMPRRGSWGPENHSGACGALVRTITLNFEERTPVKERSSLACSSTSVRKSTTVMPRLVTRSWIFVANRANPLPTPNKIRNSLFPC